ncbi:recombinase [Shigella flexneri]
MLDVGQGLATVIARTAKRFSMTQDWPGLQGIVGNNSLSPASLAVLLNRQGVILSHEHLH